MNKLHVAIRLLQLLNERQSITTRTVADALQVHVRTAQRYLNDISVLPCVVCDEERHSYSLSADYTINESLLNSQEITLIYVLLDYAAHVLGPDRAVIPAKIKQKLENANEMYHIIQEEGMEIGSLRPVRLALESAIQERKTITISYERYNTDYTVEPYRIVHAAGFWYLIARHEGKLKKFLLDYIGKVTVTGQSFPAPPAELAAKLASAHTIWFDEGEPVNVSVEFDAEVAHFFRRKQFFPEQQIVEEKEDGGIVLTMETANEMDFFQLIARWMPYFRVVEPPEYKKFIWEQARITAELNES